MYPSLEIDVGLRPRTARRPDCACAKCVARWTFMKLLLFEPKELVHGHGKLAKRSRGTAAHSSAR